MVPFLVTIFFGSEFTEVDHSNNFTQIYVKINVYSEETGKGFLSNQSARLYQNHSGHIAQIFRLSVEIDGSGKY